MARASAIGLEKLELLENLESLEELEPLERLENPDAQTAPQKTTRRFTKNKPSFSTKQHVVFPQICTRFFTNECIFFSTLQNGVTHWQ